MINNSMSDDHDTRSITSSNHSSQSAISDSETTIHAPVPVRPRLPSRKSSGPLVVPRDSLAVGPVDAQYGPDDVRAMSPRRTSEDIDRMGQQARDEMKRYDSFSPYDVAWNCLLTGIYRHAKALQDSLVDIFARIEAVKEEHDKLNNNNKFLQKYIGDLMSTSKITASAGGRSKK